MKTFLLVHGAWHGGWAWRKVRPLLAAAGYDIYAPTLAGLGERSDDAHAGIDLTTHVGELAQLLEWEDLRDVVAVGHSYAGMILSALAERAADRLAHLVYLDAFVPADGDSLDAQLDPQARAGYREGASAHGDGWLIPPPPLARWGISAPADIEWMTPRVRPQPLRTFAEAARLPTSAATRIARTYISCTVEQKPHFAAAARKINAAGGWSYRELPTGHDAMMTMPRELAALLLEAAR